MLKQEIKYMGAFESEYVVILDFEILTKMIFEYDKKLF